MSTAQKLEAVPTHHDDVLAATVEFVAAKEALEEAKKVFADAESKLLTLVGHKEEGVFNTVVADRFKVSTTGKVNYNLDEKAFADLESQAALPPALINRLIRTKVKKEINVRELKFIRENEPDIYQFLTPAIVAKPGKTAVKVEPIEDDD